MSEAFQHYNSSNFTNFTSFTTLQIHQNYKIYQLYQPYYYYSMLTVCALSLTAHTVALYTIHISKRKTNQNIILASLSAVEIIASMLSVVREVTQHLEVVMSRTLCAVYGCIDNVIYCLFLLTMYVLTTDRLVMALSPLKYKMRVTRRRVFISIVACWSSGVSYGVALYVVPDGPPDNIHEHMEMLVWLTAAGYLLLVMLTYAVIVYKIRQSRKAFANAQYPQVVRIRFGKEFLIPTIVIVTYIFLFVGPTWMIYLFPWDMITSYLAFFFIYRISLILPMVGTLVDALTYVLLSSHYKQPFLDRINECYKNLVSSLYRYRAHP